MNSGYRARLAKSFTNLNQPDESVAHIGITDMFGTANLRINPDLNFEVTLASKVPRARFARPYPNPNLDVITTPILN